MNYLKTTLFLGLLTGLLVLFGKAIGGQAGMVFALGVAAIMNFSAYWFSDKMVLKMYNAKEVSYADAPELHNIVKSLCARCNLPQPKIFIIDSATPNAFATGRNPQNAVVAVTTGILRILTSEELTGVLAHELAHVQHRDILISTIAATMAGAIGTLANFAQFAVFMGGRDRERSNPLALLAMAILAPIAAMLIQMAVSRSREFGADAGGAKLCGKPLALARALEKLEYGNSQHPMHRANQNPATAHMFIVNPLTAGNLAQLFSTHPPIAERIARLREMV